MSTLLVPAAFVLHAYYLNSSRIMREGFKTHCTDAVWPTFDALEQAASASDAVGALVVKVYGPTAQRVTDTAVVMQSQIGNHTEVIAFEVLLVQCSSCPLLLAVGVIV